MRALEQIVESVDASVEDDYRKCMLIFLGCLSLVKDDLPETGLNAFNLAEQYWKKGDMEPGKLDEARISCWEYLDSNNVPASPIEKRDCALRALICVLYPDQPSDDIGELTECFFEFIEQIEVDNQSIDNIVKRII